MPTCEYCGAEFPVKLMIDGRKCNLQRRKYCLECSPFGSRNTRKLILDKRPPVEQNCPICSRDTTGKRTKMCGGCRTEVRRYITKNAAVKLLGGKCQKCGWQGALPGYEFHHTAPNAKEFQIGNVANKSWEVIKRELEKCELLCACCHRIEHSKHDQALIDQAAKYKGRLLGG